MTKNLFCIAIIIIVLLQCTKGDDNFRSEIRVGEERIEKKEAFSENLHYYNLSLDDSALNFKFIRLKVSAPDGAEKRHFSVFVSSTSPSPQLKDSRYVSQEPDRDIFLPASFYYNIKVFYLSISDKIPLKFTFIIEPLQVIKFLTIPQFFTLDVKAGSFFEFELLGKEQIETGAVMFAVTGGSSDSKWSLNGEVESEYFGVRLKKIFHNGIGGVLKAPDMKDALHRPFFFRFSSSRDDLITIEIRHLETGKNIELYQNEMTSLILMGGHADEILVSGFLGPQGEGEYMKEKVVLWRSYRECVTPLLFAENEPTQENELVYSEYDNFIYFEKEKLSIALKKSFIFGTVQIQIIDGSIWEVNNPVFSALDIGVPASGVVLEKRAIYYRIKTFPREDPVDLLFQQFGGNLKFYYAACKRPIESCFINKYSVEYLANSKFLVEIHPVGDFAYKQLRAEEDGKEFIVVVYCEEGEEDGLCFYDLSAGTSDSFMYLSRNMRYEKQLFETEKNLFSFKVTSTTTSEIEVILYNFSGDVSLKVSTDREFKELVGKEYEVQSKKYVRVSGEDLSKEYFVSVEANTKGFYRIYFTTFEPNSIKEYQVQSGEISTETINKKEDSKIFNLLNRNLHPDIPFVTTFTTLNCKIRINFQGQEKIADRAQFVLTKKDPGFTSGRYPFKVKFLSLDTGSTREDDDCIFFITGSDNSHSSQLNEGVIHSITLDNESQIAHFSYHIYYYSSEMIIASLTKLDSSLIYLMYCFTDGQPKSKYISSSRMIFFQLDEILRGCKGKLLCRLEIFIRPADISLDKFEINFQIGITSNNLVPTYLKKGDMRLDGVISEKGPLGYFRENFPEYVYYYTDLPKNSNCEVVVDFKRGSGEAVASLYDKSNPNKSLPQKSSTGLIPFDYYNKKFVITEKDTETCEYGCELIIGVFSSTESNYFHFNEYSIFIRNTQENPTVVHLPVNEYAFGSLKKTEKEGEYNYYATNIFKDTDQIIIEFNSDLCAGYVNINSDQLPTKENHDFVIQSKDALTTIKAKDSFIKEGTFLDKKVIIGISTKTLDGKYNSFYSYRLMIPENNEKNIVEINTSGNVICKLEGGKCFFKMEIYLYHYINEVYFYAFHAPVKEEKLEIYGNVVYISEGIRPTPDFIPTEESYDFTSKDDFDTDRLCIKLDFQKKQDSFIYIMVKSSSHTGYVKLISTFFQTPLKTTLRPNSYQMFFIKKNFYADFEIKGNDVYFVEAVRLFGEGSIKTSEEEEIIELNGEKKSMATIIKPSKNTTVRLSARGSNFVFYIKYIARTDEGNFDEVAYKRLTHIHYHKETFPITYFIPVEATNSDVVVTVQFTAKENEDVQSTEDFVLTGAITDENYVISRKKSIDDNPTVEAYGEVSYNKELNLAKFVFKKEDIADSNRGIKRFFFIQIKQALSNTIKYENVTFDVFATPVSSSKIKLPINQYFYTLINGDTLIQMKKKDPQDTSMRVELALDSTGFEVVISNDKEETLTNIKEEASFGKKVYQINGLNDTNYASLKIIPREDTSINLMIKYKTFKDTKRILNFERQSQSISFTLSKEVFKGRVTPIKYANAEGPLKVKYTLRLFEFNKFESQEQLNSLGNIELPFQSFRGKIESEEEVRFEIKSFPKGEYYINVIAVLAEEKEQFLYKTEYIKNDSFTVVLNNKSAWVIFGLVCVVIVFLGVVFVLHRSIVRVKSKQKSDLINYSRMR